MSGPTVGGGGLGRYVEELTKNLAEVDQRNRYVLFEASPMQHDVCSSPEHPPIPGNACASPSGEDQHPVNEPPSVLQGAHITHRRTPVPWYTLAEQLWMPNIIDRERLDLLHVPHWNVPIRLKTPFVVTIHDLILLEEPRSARATTRHPLVYALKYAGFKRVLAHALRASKKIIAVSEATKQDILKHFPDVPDTKIVVIYEGITPLHRDPLANTADLGQPEKPVLLAVGNTYPHKNHDALLDAFDLLHAARPDLRLIFAGRDDAFSRALQQKAQTRKSAHAVTFVKNPTDEKIAELYAQATMLVFPSRVEGFGLPPLEAMASGTPVACSNIPSLREILADAAAYFDPSDRSDMARVIGNLLDHPPLREQLVAQGNKRIKRYDWKRMAEQTVRVYEECNP